MTKATPPPVERPSLTVKEAKVASGIGRFLSYPEIAGETGICFETVRSIVARLRRKTGQARKAELAVWAVRQAKWLESVAANGKARA